MSQDRWSLPGAVTSEVFARWRSPVRGSRNPDRLNNPFWDWMVKSRVSAYEANKLLNGPSPFVAGPAWCFQRFGQTTSPLSKDRTVLIGGEHEDWYDPDFYIYNDVVVLGESGSIDIYSYPYEVFPPTDFHSASVLEDQVLLIGNLGYSKDRREGQTQVIVIEAETFAAKDIDTFGASPGWIHGHHAEMADDGKSILLTGGKVWQGGRLLENIDAWRLHLSKWQWERLTDHRWVRFEVFREDKRENHLWNLRAMLLEAEIDWTGLLSDELLQQREARRTELQSEIGSPLRLDLMPHLYKPPIPHEELPSKEDEFGVYRIRIAGTIVRYVEDSQQVQVTVEGNLLPETIEMLQRDLVQKLEEVEQATFAFKETPPL